MIKTLRRGLMAAALAFAVLAPASPAQADEVTLMDGITALPVAEEIREGYKRELYPHWKDDDRNGCSARNDVLIAEAIEAPTIGSGCSLTGGVWHSYYDDVLAQGPSGARPRPGRRRRHRRAVRHRPLLPRHPHRRPGQGPRPHRLPLRPTGGSSSPPATPPRTGSQPAATTSTPTTSRNPGPTA